MQGIISNSSSRRLGNRAPITLRTGMIASKPFHFTLVTLHTESVADIEEVKMTQRLKVDKLLDALDKMQKIVHETQSENREQAVVRCNFKTHVPPFKPTVSHHVLIARTSGPRTKLFSN